MSKFVLTAILTIFLGLICLSSVCSSRIAGGWSDLDLNNESVKNVAHFAVDMYNKQSNAMNIHQLIAIKSAKSQVVSGRKFEIVFAVGETNCSKNGIQKNDIRECPLSNTKVSLRLNNTLMTSNTKGIDLQEIQILSLNWIYIIYIIKFFYSYNSLNSVTILTFNYTFN